jgi:hypothetical protein
MLAAERFHAGAVRSLKLLLEGDMAEQGKARSSNGGRR